MFFKDFAVAELMSMMDTASWELFHVPPYDDDHFYGQNHEAFRRPKYIFYIWLSTSVCLLMTLTSVAFLDSLGTTT